MFNKPLFSCLAAVLMIPAAARGDDPEGTLCGAEGQVPCCDTCCDCNTYVFGVCVCPTACNCACDAGLVEILGFCYPPLPCGGNGELCCNPGCVCDTQWLQQYAGVCGPCGGSGQPYCINGTPCQPGLQNVAGICMTVSCGGNGELCCSPGCVCDTQWLQQYFGVCGPCGGAGEPYCINGTACQPGLTNVAGICTAISCGAEGEICCEPNCSCDNQWLQQYFGICGPCGGDGEPYCLNGTACQTGLTNVAGICFACSSSCSPQCPNYDPCADCGPLYVDAAASPPGNGSQTNPFPTVTAAMSAVGNCFKEIRIAGADYPEVLTIDKNVRLVHNGGPVVRIGN